MADINTGTPIRFKNGGRIDIGADTLIGLEGHGLMSLVQGSFERATEYEGRNILRECVGDERPTTFEITGKVRYNQTTPGGALATLRSTWLDNVLVERSVVINLRKDPATSAVTRLTLSKVVFDDITITPGGGPDGVYDTFRIAGKHLGPCPAWADATLA